MYDKTFIGINDLEHDLTIFLSSAELARNYGEKIPSKIITSVESLLSTIRCFKAEEVERAEKALLEKLKKKYEKKESNAETANERKFRFLAGKKILEEC
jgi:lipoate-protein ligase A